LTYGVDVCVMICMKMNTFRKHLIFPVAAATLVITSCGPSGSDHTAWHAATAASYQGLRSVANTSSVKIPVLQSKAFESKWGKPKVELNGTGGYRLSYSNPSTPFDRLVIYGSSTAFPALSSPPKASFDEMVNGELGVVKRAQSWRTVMVAGKKVRYFQESGPGGADGAYYSTEGFSVTGPDGKTGYYRMVVEAGNDEAPVRQRFSSAKL
jgi:hypothetical protein